ncbi:Fc receptor-like protein 5 isoform X2 [Carassius auratus]|uniref:Fc receptor-like protein 5 isoform X2 n=1 Tax=Carassius auratus TaxID=7957 RepID=A0A6P6M8D0_CARAU|nr:Fc receptor-like protein 5 isoform X2 [Carassius auratus]
MELSPLPLLLLLISNIFSQHTEENPKATVSIKPAQHVFRGETVTLRCDVYSEGVTSWQYVWYKEGSGRVFSDLQQHTFSPVTESDAGKYFCIGAETGGSRTSLLSDEVTLTVSVPRAVLSVSPQKWLTEGDSVTLICQVNGSSTGWTFSWFTLTLSSDYRYHYDLLSDSSRGAGGNYTVSSADLKHTGVYVCSAERGKPAYNSTISNTQLLWVTENPKARVSIKPAQHVFRGETVTLRCDVYSEGVSSWQYVWYKEGSGRVFSDLQQHTFSPVTESDAGKYFCIGAETGGSRTSRLSDEVTLTVSVPRAVLSVSPQKWLTEGDSVTLICQVNGSSTGWTFSWFTLTLSSDYRYHYDLLSDSSRGAGGNYTVSSADLKHTGVYACSAERGKPAYNSDISNTQLLWVTENPKARVSIKPAQHVFRGETVTLRCDVYSEGVTSWQYVWYKEGSGRVFSDLQQHTFSPVTESDAGKYFCIGAETGGSRTSRLSDEVTLTVSVPRAVLSVSPQKWLTEGDSVTLICQVNGSSTGWTFSWFTLTLSSDNSNHYDLLSDSSRGAGGNYTVSSADLKHTGVYACSAERGKPAFNSTISNTQLLWVTENPKATVSIKPAQHVFRGETVTLRCDVYSEGVTSWQYVWYKEGSGRVFSDLQQHTFSPVTESDAGKYFCYGAERGGSRTSHRSDKVTLTVSVPRAVLSVSPQKWLTEGDSVTLICQVNGSSTGWTFSWFTLTLSSDNSSLYKRLSDSSRGAGGNYTVSSADLKHTGVYACSAERGKPAYNSTISNTQLLWVTENPKARVSIKPAQHVFRGETVTLRCDVYSEGVNSWQYTWYKHTSISVVSELQEHTFSSVTESDAGKYFCIGAESKGSRISHSSDDVTLTVSASVPRAVLSVSPQKWLTEGDSVTLICQVNGSSTGWTFSWFTETVSSDNSNRYKRLSDSSRGAGGHYTVSSADLKHTGVYVCRAERGKPVYHSTISNKQLLWVTGVSPPVSLIVSPSTTQHFTSVSLSLSCEGQSNSAGWRMRRYSDKWGLEDCSSMNGSQTGSTCTIRDTFTGDTGVYWCESESGENSHPVNITVHLNVILESPVHPVTEGETLTLRCLYQHSTPPNLRADFYKDGSLIQSQTTEMIISTVSKSDEGFYSCKHREKGESPESWISVTASSRTSGSDLNPVIVGVTAGLTFLIIVVLVLLWRYRNNKGERSQSLSRVSQQKNSSQTSEQNQSEAGHKTLTSGTAHIYDSLDATINNGISTDTEDIVSGPSELTYAEIELKSTEKQKKKKENKGNTSESSDPVYSQLNLETHQG